MASRLVPAHWMKNGKLVPMDDAHGYPESLSSNYINLLIKGYTKPHVRLSGASGLVSTAEDYWRFAQMMENGGESAGHRFLSPSTVQYMTPMTQMLGPGVIESETLREQIIAMVYGALMK